MSSLVDIIVPTVTGREETLDRCLLSYEQFTNPADVRYTFIVIRDEDTCGIAWRKGLELSKAPYVHLSCDDLEVRSDSWAEACIESVDEGFLPCPIVYRPDDTLESCGGDMNRGGNLIGEVLEDKTQVDFTTVPFMSREQADAIGMIDAHYKSDVYVSHRGRQLGYETQVRTAYAFTHHHSEVKRRGYCSDDDHAYNQGMSRG